MARKSLTIAVDFDGTMVTHMFPKIGQESPGCSDVLKELAGKGVKIILYTMRSNLNCLNPITGKLVSNDTTTKKAGLKTTLEDAVGWCRDREIPLYGVNYNPSQRHWTTSPKVYADLYIDDCAAGVPMRIGADDLPVVDWERIRDIVLNLLG